MKKREKTFKKLNFGCGNDYRKGFVNIDFNREIKADVYVDFDKGRLPFKENTFNYVYMSHVLEHLKNFFKVMDEIWRICKPNAILEIYTPHFTSIVALKYPDHYSQFGIDSFRLFEKEPICTKERYGKARFEVLKQRLHFNFINPKNEKYRWLRIFNIINPLFNFSTFWQLLMERFFFPGFDEIYYKLKVIK